ncbi:hypothetical protein BJY01DRAFT_260606 [Aspergillus pseudoustus]|uniref:Actin-like ATPase domain-containing protein n=1 Tax=Aspergillus pseudoustus TaxID=1810923 RepID=A0ABR4IU60_9EURO
MCLDYGTAFTSISYIVFDPADPPVEIGPSAVQSVRDWPQATGHFHAGNACVPSESWYRDGQQYLWGHAVQQTLRTMSEEDVASTNRVVQLAKLLLDYDHDKDGQDQGQSGASGDPLLEIKNVLRNVGKTAKEVVKDYLTQVFRHAHQQLARREGFNRSWEVELALCVPSKWSTYAHLTMQEIALEVTAATGIQAGGDFSLFIIDEPEAAVTFALRYDHIRDRIEEDSNFIVCDAGGKDCGSSYINQALSEEAKRRLANVSGLGSETVYSKEAVIHHDLFRAFEQEVKRTYDPAEMDEAERIAVRLWGLRADPDKDFGHGIFYITK